MLLCKHGTCPSDATKICKLISLILLQGLHSLLFEDEVSKVGGYM